MLVVVVVCLVLLAALCTWLFKTPGKTGTRKPAADTDWHSRRGLKAAMAEEAPATGKSYLVLGTGSVGMAILDALLERGETRVKGFDIAPPKCSKEGAEFISGNVTDYAAVKAACEGVDVVFATFALIRYYERLPFQYAESHAVNVTGTENLIQACVECGVQVLVQTSSSNVCVAEGAVSTEMDEGSPYVDASSSPNHYGWTKAQAEQAVLKSDSTPSPAGRGTLRTGVARPCSAIFGPNDKLITERALREGKAQLLCPESFIDWVFVENVVWGHLLLEKKLHEQPERVGGYAFCICNEEPMYNDEFFVALQYFYEQRSKQKMQRIYLPRGLMHTIGWCAEAYQSVTGKRIKGEIALLSPAAMKIALLSYAFPNKKARELLGYRPLYNVDEGLQKTVDHMLQTIGHADAH